MKLLLAAYIFVFTFNSYSTEVVLFGGGGEPAGDTTIFDSALKLLAPKKSLLDFQLKSSFNGGHKTAEDIIANQLQTPNVPFTEDNYTKIVNEYVEKIKSGQIKSGEKLLILLDTHGGEGSSSHKTHSIAMSGAEVQDKSVIRGKGSSSVDKLFALSQIAKEKGIKLGIVDFSCHSGNSLPLANENTCVISSSGTNHFGYGTFAEKFFEKMEKGKSLEDVFLDTRKEVDVPSFPMISTDIGKQINNEQYDLFSPYLNTVNKEGDADKLSPYLRSMFDGTNYCKRESDYKNLFKQMEDFQKISGVLRSRYLGEENLLDVLKSYKNDQDDFINTLAKMEFSLYETKEIITYGTAPKNKAKKTVPLTENLTWRDILIGYPTGNISYFKEQLAQRTSPGERLDLMNSIAKYEKIDEKRQEILKNHPGLKETSGFFKSLRTKSDSIWQKSAKISELANKFYDNRYRQLQSTEPENANPCRDFVL